MFYTGFENHTDEELLALTYVETNMLALELAKRMSSRRDSHVPPRRLPTGMGLNPIPNPIGDEL